jgi:hypothetical protein
VVVGDDPLDAEDAGPGERVGRAEQKRGTRRALLVGKDLRVGEPGVVVD